MKSNKINLLLGAQTKVLGRPLRKRTHFGVFLMAFSTGCAFSPDDSDFSTRSQLAIQDGPEGAAVALTLSPLRTFDAPGPVSISRVRETFHSAGSFQHTVYFSQPDPSAQSFVISLRALTMSNGIEWSHTFNNVSLVRNVGAENEVIESLDNGTAYKYYTVTSSPGQYALRFEYGVNFAERKLQVEVLGSGGSKLPIQWVDPPGELDLDVELSVTSQGSNPVFLKGGSYQSASDNQSASVQQVTLDQGLMYQGGFDQGLFNFPLGIVTSGTHTLEFTLRASQPAKYWYGVSKQSFDPTGSRQRWAPVQFLYQGEMHTGDYDAWSEGVAHAQGPSLLPGDVRPPPVRRGTDLVVSVEHDNLSWGDASLQVVTQAGGATTGFSAIKQSDYEGGYFQGTNGRQVVRRELWQVHVPEDVPVGRYRLRVAAPGGQSMEDVLFYVVFDPYLYVENYQLSRDELETFGYDEDDDGVDMNGPYGTDDDSWRDNFTANYQPDPYSAVGQDTKVTGSFRRTTQQASYSLLDHAVAVTEGTQSEFEAMRRLYRFVAQKIQYTRQDIRDDSSLLLIGTNNSFTPDESALAAVQGAWSNHQAGGECFDYGTSLAAMARSVGILARSVSAFSVAGFSNHVLTEAYIPDLPHHGGGTVPYWTKNHSDVDPWYVFDATSPVTTQTNPTTTWQYSTEAIGPRAMYTLGDRIVSGWQSTTTAYTAGLSWDPFTDTAPSGTVDDVSASYNQGNEFWLNQSMSTITGYLGVGEKDVYSVGRAYNGATGVRLTALPGGSTSILPKMCMVPRQNNPVLSTRCNNPSSQVTLPNDEVYLVIFNDAVVEDSHLGDSLEYKLELLY